MGSGGSAVTVQVARCNSAAGRTVAKPLRGWAMGQLTVEERRRIFNARQRTGDDMLTCRFAPAAAPIPCRPRRRLHQIVTTIAIAVLLSAGWFACRTFELHVPASIVEALPRLCRGADSFAVQ